MLNFPLPKLGWMKLTWRLSFRKRPIFPLRCKTNKMSLEVANFADIQRKKKQGLLSTFLPSTSCSGMSSGVSNPRRGRGVSTSSQWGNGILWMPLHVMKCLKLPSTKAPSLAGCAALGQVPERSGGAAIPGDIQKLTRSWANFEARWSSLRRRTD